MDTTNNATAVEAIANLAEEASEKQRIYGHDLHEGLTAIILDDRKKLVSLEANAPGRYRYRGSFSTHSIAALADHVNNTVKMAATAPEDTRTPISPAGFIDVEAMTARVFFNLGTPASPGHGDHIADIKLKPTAAFAALLAITSRKLDQRALHDYVEDYRDHLSPIYSSALPAIGEPGKLPSALAAIRDIDVKTAREAGSQVSDFGASASTLEKVEVVSKHLLPLGFLWTGTPYEGLPQRTLTLRLGVNTTNDVIGLAVVIRQRETVIEAIGEDFRAELAKALGADVPLTLGTFKA